MNYRLWSGLGLSVLLAACGANPQQPVGEQSAEEDGGDADLQTAEPPICDEETFAIERLPVNLMIALDMSGSMVGTKYSTAVTAITNSLNRFSGQINFGFDPYPDNFAARSCSVSGPVAFDCGLGNEGAISQWLNTHSPTSGAGDPLVRLLDRFINEPGYAPNFTGVGDAYLVVVADGDDCCGPQGTYNCSISYVSEVGQRTADLLAMGVKSIPVGYTQNADEATMNAIAAAGGTQFTTYIPAANATALEDALDTIATSVVSCEFDISNFDASNDPDKVNMYIDGARVDFDEDCSSGQGWTWGDASFSSLRLCDDVCSVLSDGDDHDVTAKFGCPTTVVQ